MALRSREVSRRDAPTAEMQGGRMYMYEHGAHQHQRHRPLPDTFRPALPPGLQHLARRFMPEDLRARLQVRRALPRLNSQLRASGRAVYHFTALLPTLVPPTRDRVLHSQVEQRCH